MSQCKVCGSFAFNLKARGIDQSDLCDTHYWKDQAESLRAENAKLSARIAELEEAKKWLAAGQQNIAIVAKLEKAQSTIAAQSAALEVAKKAILGEIRLYREHDEDGASEYLTEALAAIEALPKASEGGAR